MNLSASIDCGLDYLCTHQASPGYWSDWQLPPGESRMWTTAYVGYRLSSLPARYRASMDEQLMRAEAWLRAAELAGGGGWGYSELTGPDADSTALALLFLRAQGRPVTSDRSLHAYQQADGGFSTYTRDASHGGWVQSQPDVTATALHALLPTAFVLTQGLPAALRYVQRQQRADGLWNSYWWTSCLYATQAMLACLSEAGEKLDCSRLTASLCRVPAPTAFESALLLMCLTQLGNASHHVAAGHARLLQAGQLPDGSWSSQAMLRLTSREISEPWLLAEAGLLFRDEKRLFTTATVLAALGRFEAA